MTTPQLLKADTKVAADLDPGPGLEIKPSPTDGLGLFATRFFSRGEVVDAKCATHADDPFGGHRYEESDAARFTNHADSPTAKLEKTGVDVRMVAAQDISPGDEITVDYRKVADALEQPFTLWYRGQPYNGESTAGSGRVKQAIFGDLGEALQTTLVNPVISGMAANRGMVFAPGTGDLVDRMDKLREQQELFKATADAADADQPTYRRMLGGVAGMAGVDPNKPQIARALDRAGRDVAGISPYLRAYMPELWERLHGWRGSAANMAAKLHQTAQGQRDPLTGVRGYGSTSTGERAKHIFGRLYGPGVDPGVSAGFSAAQMGNLDATARAKGWLGQQGGLTFDRHADRLADLARPMAAARDLAATHMPNALKQAAHALAGRRFVNGKEQVVCPHCDQPIRVADLYRDNKGWLFHRPCLVKGKGPIRLTAKVAFDTNAGADILEKLTQGQLPNMDPRQVGVDVRQVGELAKTTPGGLGRIMSLLGQGGDEAQAANMPRVMATRSAPSAAAFGGAYNQLAGGQGFAGLTPDEALLLDQQLRLSAAGSPMANMMAATLALNDAGLLHPGSPGANVAQALKNGNPVLPDGSNIGRMTPNQWVELMTASGVSQQAAWEQFRARESNREYAHKYNLGDVARSAQSDVEIKPILQNFLGQGMLPTLHAAGMAQAGPNPNVEPLSASLTHALTTMPADMLTGDRSTMVNALAQRLATEHPGLASQLGPRGLNEMVHTALTNVDQAVRSDPRLSGYRNLNGMLTAHRPDILQAGTAAMTDSRQEALVRDRTAHLGQQDWLQRLSDTAQDATPDTGLGTFVTRGFGAVPGAPVTDAVNHATTLPVPHALTEQAPYIDAARADRRKQLDVPQPLSGSMSAPMKLTPFVPGKGVKPFGKGAAAPPTILTLEPKAAGVNSDVFRRIFPWQGHYSLNEGTKMNGTKTASRTVGPYTAVIDRPKGFEKTFPTPTGGKKITYPVDYGYLSGLINPDDNEDLDVFFGSGGPHYGRFMKGQDLTGEWKPDERKWFHGLTDEEKAAVIDMYDQQSPGLLRDHTAFADEQGLLADVASVGRKQAGVVVNDSLYFALYDPTEFELPGAQ